MRRQGDAGTRREEEGRHGDGAMGRWGDGATGQRRSSSPSFLRRVAASPLRCVAPSPRPRVVLLFGFVFWLGGAGGFDPGVPSAFQSTHFFVAFVEKHLRHTGAGVLARSGTVDDDLAVAGNLTQARFNFVHRNAYRAFDFNLAVVVRTWAARVNDEDRRVLGELGFQLLNRDARDFAFRLVLGGWRLGDGL